MNIIKNIIRLVPVVILLGACTTGGFDQNTKLDELNAELAKAPTVASISVNGTVVERNTLSIREIEASIGDDLNLVATLESGANAQLEELEFLRQYFSANSASLPAEAGSDGFYDVSGVEQDFEFTYTVPAVDDDGDDFHSGDHIIIQFRVRNSNDFFGYKEFQILLVDP